MSAELLGQRLLAEVQEEDLDVLLRTIRAQTANQRTSIFGVPALDRLLLTFCRPRQDAPHRPGWTSSPDISSQDQFSHNASTLGGTVHNTDPANAQARAPIVELTSSRVPSGKTNLLYYLTAYSILPTDLGGYSSAVVWLDTDARFSATRLCQVAHGLVSKNSPDLSTDQVTATARTALQHVHVFPIPSSTQLLQTLDGLSSYLLDSTAHPSSSRRLGLVVLDSATAFYWQDRLDFYLARLGTGPTAHSMAPSQAPKTAGVIRSLKTLQQHFECAVLVTTNSDLLSIGVTSTMPTPQQPQGQPALSPWATFATVSLRLTRVPVPQFASSMTIEESQRDQEKRFEAVAKGRFVAVLDRSRSASWASGVQEAVARLHNGGNFAFRVTEEGVEVV